MPRERTQRRQHQSDMLIDPQRKDAASDRNNLEGCGGSIGIRTLRAATRLKGRHILGFRSLLFGLVALLVFLGMPQQAQAFTYLFAGESSSPDTVTHPVGYMGLLGVPGGVVDITVGIDPSSAFASEMEISIQNVITTWNNLVVSTDNIKQGLDNNVPSGSYDFESVMLHEMGHALGLGHSNTAMESGLSGSDVNYTNSEEGINGVFDLNPGADGVIGSSDDLRGDDVNLNWFNSSSNNPFDLPATGVIDSTTYSRQTAALPSGDTFSASGHRNVAALEGYGNTETVMTQGIGLDEAQRTLAADDVAGILYGMNGINELQGDSDDYTINLIYAGLDASADLLIDFDNSRTSFAGTSAIAWSLGSDHKQAYRPRIYLNTLTDPGSSGDWFFNDEILPLIGDADGDGDVDLSDLILATGSFTGPGDFNVTPSDGDVDPYPYGDGDVDIDDIIVMVSNFSGPLDEQGGPVSADAGNPGNPDLLYDFLTGEVFLDSSESTGGIITTYSLKTDTDAFLSGNHMPYLGALETTLPGELAEGPSLAGETGINSIGMVFPVGMDAAALDAFLTQRNVTGTFGTGTLQFDLFVINAPSVPEPASVTLLAMAMLGLFFLRRRRSI